MYALRIGLLVIHIAAAAFLFGGMLGMPRLIRKSLDLGTETLKMACLEAKKRAVMSALASIATLWTGVGLIFLMGGFKVAPINFHMALGLMLGAVAINLTLMRPTVKSLVQESAKPEPARGTIESLLKRVSMAQGILHLLWIINLILMFHRIYSKTA
jgi:hypothetical protein